MIATDNKWLTPPQVAEMLAVDSIKVRKWILSGELTACDLSQEPTGNPRWRIRPADLEAFLQRRQPHQPTPTKRRRNRGTTEGGRY